MLASTTTDSRPNPPARWVSSDPSPKTPNFWAELASGGRKAQILEQISRLFGRNFWAFFDPKKNDPGLEIVIFSLTFSRIHDLETRPDQAIRSRPRTYELRSARTNKVTAISIPILSYLFSVPASSSASTAAV